MLNLSIPKSKSLLLASALCMLSNLAYAKDSYSILNAAVGLSHANGKVIGPTNPVSSGRPVPVKGKNGGLVPLNVSYYLDEHPNVARAIHWVFNDKWVEYKDWPKADQKRLDMAYFQMVTGEFDASFPPSLFNTTMSSEIETSAKNMYISHVAHAIWLEMAQAVDWRLHEYSDTQLRDLLDGRSLIKEKLTQERGTTLANFVGIVTPSEALKPFKFALDNKLVAADTLATTNKLLTYMHFNLMHSSDEFVNAFNQNHQHGFPLSGAIYPEYAGISPHSEKKVLTAYGGCHGASDAIRLVLRSLNIPSRLDNFYTLHLGLNFTADKARLLHTDDIYAIPTNFDIGITPVKTNTVRPQAPGAPVPFPGGPTGGPTPLPPSFLYGHRYIDVSKFLILEAEFNSQYKNIEGRYGDMGEDKPIDRYSKRQFLTSLNYPSFVFVKLVVDEYGRVNQHPPADWLSETNSIKNIVSRFYHGPFTRFKISQAEANAAAVKIAQHLQSQLKPIGLDKAATVSRFEEVKRIYEVAIP